MISNQDIEDTIWRRCEVAWSEWLQARHFAVFHTGEALGNSRGTRAPLMAIEGQSLRAPDLQTTKQGISEYWEIKYRSRSDLDPLTGERIHWISDKAFADYVAISDATGCTVWMVLYEGPTSTSRGRWLRANVKTLEAQGSSGRRFGRGGVPVPAWTWPVEVMEVVSGPDVDVSSGDAAILPAEGEPGPNEISGLDFVERQLRLKDATVCAETDVASLASPETWSLLQKEPTLGLDLLRRRLGIPSLPRYSVLRIGLNGIDIDDLLGLLHYGIRVFLISAEATESLIDPGELQAFVDSRLLERAAIGDSIGPQDECWIVDGAFPTPESHRLRELLNMADDAGGINTGQYRIVHAPSSADMLITAGAGTGKTETMSERLIFLLSTFEGVSEPPADCDGRHVDLRLDDVVLMTFTREAALEMRERISYTIMLRQRLCRRNVLPSLAWLMQLGSTEIATIHTFAKRILKSTGGGLGWGPELKVSRHTLALREVLHHILSPYLSNMIDSHADEVPPSYLWEDHLEKVWAALEGNGVGMIRGDSESDQGLPVIWGDSGSQGLHGSVEEATRFVIQAAAARYRDLCVDSQAVRAGDLVPLALASLQSQEKPSVRKPRFLFVDEFQDTDPSQMDLILETKARLGAHLFVVGDGKQGIYRFRGAEGNAFQQLRNRIRDRGLEPFLEEPLSRNYRSGATLLHSIHPFFSAWHSTGHLVYAEDDRLRPVTWDADLSEAIEFPRIKRNSFVYRAAEDVAEWRQQDPEASIAILCRQNAQAIAVKRQIEKTGGYCELLIGGDFFRSPAVRELVAFLRAVAQPDDDSALLQLCETRWASGLLVGDAPEGLAGPEWQAAIAPISGWRERIASLEPSGSYDRSDLVQLRQRVTSIGDLLGKMPLMAWLVECARTFAPEATQRIEDSGDYEQNRYARCLDHAITLLDSQFESRPISLQRLLSWLQLQVATNHSEDEPVNVTDRRATTIALTVHKAKGLEFDRVLIPNTWTPFGSGHHAGTKATVLRGESGLPRLIWKWSVGSEQFSNVSPNQEDLWHSDSWETAREEARLLYVALTRAKRGLRVYVPSRGEPNDDPSSWADFLKYGR